MFRADTADGIVSSEAGAAARAIGAPPLRWLERLDALPPLRDRWLLAYRLLFALLATAAATASILAVLQTDRGIALSALRFVQGTVLVAVAVMLFRRRPEDPIAGFLSTAFLIWTITSAGEASAPAALMPWLAGLDRLRFMLLVAAVMLFPAGRFEPGWTRAALLASLLVFLIGVGGVTGLVPASLFLPPAVLCVAAAIGALIVRFRRTEAGVQRQQMKWVALGMASGLAAILAYRIGSAMLPAAPPAAGPWPILLEAAFRVGILLMALGFLVSLLRYRLYDAEAAISRSAAYVVLTFSLVGIFAASEATIELLGQRYLGGRAGDFSAAMAAAVAAVLIAPLHGQVTRWAERRFQRDLVVLKEELPKLVGDADQHADIAALAAVVLPRLEAGVRAVHIALAIDGAVAAAHDMPRPAAQAWLDSWHPPDCAAAFDIDAGDALFPLRIPLAGPDSRHFAWILFGPRPDQSFYRQDELEALAEVAAPLRRAVAAVRRRELRQAEAGAWRRRQAARLAALHRRLAALQGRKPRRSRAR